MGAIDFEKLEAKLRSGEVPEAWVGSLDGVDPSTLLIIMWAGRLSRRVDVFYQELLRQYGLTYSDYAVLSLLRFSGGMSPKGLNGYLAITSGGLTKTIQRLESEKLVRRAPDPEDGRGTVISLSKKGEQLVARIFAEDIRSHEELFQEISPNDRKRIASSLRELLDVFEGAQLG